MVPRPAHLLRLREGRHGHIMPMTASAVTLAVYLILVFGMVALTVLLVRLIASRWRR
ncbi:MAG TPA: hypothetical protein VE288_10235 [Rubrobacteraceae bacterium]|nr:hypothetical protein [Rubrobacteraceae bacterium]